MLKRCFLFFCIVSVFIACGDDDSSSDYLTFKIDGTIVKYNAGCLDEEFPATAWTSKDSAANEYVIFGQPTITALSNGTPDNYLMIAFTAVTNASGEFLYPSSTEFFFHYNGAEYIVDSFSLLIYEPPGSAAGSSGHSILTHTSAPPTSPSARG